MPAVTVCQPVSSQTLRSFTQEFSNVEQVVVNHNLGSYSIIVMAWSTGGQQILPQIVLLQTSNIAVVVFGVPLSGTIVVTGVRITGA